MASEVCTLAREPETNDLFLDTNGNIALAFGKDAYEQIVNAKMKTVSGEVPFNLRLGLPYFDTVFKSASNIEIWRSEAIRMLKGISFVDDVLSFDCNFSQGVVKYTSKILTKSGAVELNGKSNI